MRTYVPRLRLQSVVFLLAVLLAQLALVPRAALADQGEYTPLRYPGSTICHPGVVVGRPAVTYEVIGACGVLPIRDGGANVLRWAPHLRAFSLRPVSNKNLCVDIPSAQQVQGNQLQLWDCNGLIEAQGFFFSNWDNGTINTIARDLSDPAVVQWRGSACLGVSDPTVSRGSVFVARCDGSTRQKWDYDHDNLTIANDAGANLCMHVVGNVVRRGAKINLYQCGLYSFDRLELEQIAPA